MKIAFAGKTRAGKDHSVKYLINKYGGQKIFFAEYLYDILYYAQKICGFPLQKDRKFLQYIGTEWARQQNPNIWTDLTIQNMPKEGNVFCSDVRFLNEFDRLKENGFTMVKITRNINRNRYTDQHASEVDLDDLPNYVWDYVIENNGTPSDLYYQLDTIFLDTLDKEMELQIHNDIAQFLHCD